MQDPAFDEALADHLLDQHSGKEGGRVADGGQVQNLAWPMAATAAAALLPELAVLPE